MITATTRELFKTHRDAEKRDVQGSRKHKSEVGKLIAPPEETVVDPMTTLGLPEHECRRVTELHMGQKGMTRLHPSFLTFTNLEELWLNENKLKRVVGLLPRPDAVTLANGGRGCCRLKRLYLSGNLISSLEGDILRLGHLEVLLLANNRLSNLEAVSAKLKSLRFLRQLDLFGNPLAEEQNYRFFLIHRHPNLQLLDRQAVSDDERRAAAAFFRASGGGSGLGGRQTLGTSVGSMSSSGIELPPQPLASMRAPAALPVGFGSHLPPHTDATRPTAAVSMTAKLVASKVKQLQMKERAAAEIERQRDETEANARAEKRRLFHSIWATSAAQAAQHQHQQQQPAGGKPHTAPANTNAATSSSSLGFMPAPSAEAARSRLFDGDGASPVNELIELARQRELATTDQRRAEVDAMIARAKHKMLPERLGDGFGGAAQKAKEARAPAVEAEYTENVLRNVFTAFEHEQCAKAFGSNPVNANDAPGLMKLMQRCPGVSQSDFGSYFQRRLGRRAAAGVPLREAMRIAADYEPFLIAREADLSRQAQTAVTRGSGAAAAGTYRVANFVADHLRRVQKEEAISRGTSRADDAGVGRALDSVFARRGAREMAANVVDSDDD